MAKKKVTEVAEELLAGFLEKEGYELYHTEFAKEGSDWFLRVYIDLKPDEGGEERYVSTDDCEKVSRFLSEAMDEADPIEQNYYLEVSSPGMDRPLIRPEHWQRYVGHEIEVRLYRGKDGTKNIAGMLDAFDPERILITDESGKQWELALSEIAKAKLAVIF